MVVLEKHDFQKKSATNKPVSWASLGAVCSHSENRMRELQQEAVCIVTCEIHKTSLFCIRNHIHSIKTFLWKYILFNLTGLDSDHNMLSIGIRG